MKSLSRTLNSYLLIHNYSLHIVFFPNRIDDDWLQLRRKVGPILLKPKEAVDMLEHVNGAAQDLVRALLQHVHQTGTLVPDLTQWTVRYGTEGVLWDHFVPRTKGDMRYRERCSHWFITEQKCYTYTCIIMICI